MASLVRLQPHPLTHDVPEISVEAALARHADQLMLQYQIRGKVAVLRVPALADARRRDELWQHTCAEAFVTTPGGRDYYEFNFSPSGEWAAYAFDDYRSGMRDMDCAPPVMDVRTDANTLLVQVQCTLPDSWARQPLQAGLAMVIEDLHGQCSYWALQHPGDKPDFHHRDGFMLVLGC